MPENENRAAQSCLRFSIPVGALPLNGLACALKTDARERAALAQAHGLLAVQSFSAEFRLRPWKKQGVRVEGHIVAAVEQQCVITAEPLAQRVDKQFEVFFVPEKSRLAKAPAAAGSGELFLDPEGADMPEIFSGGAINLGAVAEEFFELELDPYPRRPGAALSDVLAQSAPPAAKAADRDSEAADSGKRASPFAVLRDLKKP